MGGIVRCDGGAGTDIGRRLNKARNLFKMMKNVRRSSQYGTLTKIKISHGCVLCTLLVGSQCWQMTESDLRKLIGSAHTVCTASSCTDDVDGRVMSSGGRLHWTPEGRRKRGRPKNTWGRTLEMEMRGLGNRRSSKLWKSYVAALCGSRHAPTLTHCL